MQKKVFIQNIEKIAQKKLKMQNDLLQNEKKYIEKNY